MKIICPPMSPFSKLMKISTLKDFLKPLSVRKSPSVAIFFLLRKKISLLEVFIVCYKFVEKNENLKEI